MEDRRHSPPPGQDAPASARLIALLEYWSSKCGAEGRPPRRADLDPADLRGLLPNLMLFDVEHTPPGFRFRLVGTRMVEVLGHDPTGCLLADYPEGGALAEPLRRTAAGARPQATPGTLCWTNGDGVDAEWLFLPLAGDGDDIAMILAGADFFGPSLVHPEGTPEIGLDPTRDCPAG